MSQRFWQINNKFVSRYGLSTSDYRALDNYRLLGTTAYSIYEKGTVEIKFILAFIQIYLCL